MNKYQLLISQGSTIFLGIVTLLFVTAKRPELQAQEVDGNTTIEEITEDESIAVGEEVTVRGEVEEVEPGVSFVLQEEGFLQGDEVLVINVADEILLEGAEDLKLQVTGKIGQLILADVEAEYGLTFDRDLYVEYENQPVILATNMVLSPDIEDVSEDPEKFYDLEIALQGEVDEIRSDYTFTLAEDELFEGDDLLIINATGEPLPETDENIVVTGVVRPYIKAEFEKDYDLTWDLGVQEEVEAEYTEKPVLVVDSIYPSAEDDDLGLLD